MNSTDYAIIEEFILGSIDLISGLVKIPELLKHYHELGMLKSKSFEFSSGIYNNLTKD